MSKPTAKQQIEILGDLSQAAAAALLGVGQRTLREWHDAPRLASGRYRAAELVRWRIEQLVEAERSRLAVDDPDPMLAGADSPALEEYRRLRAEQVRLDLAERKGELVATEDLEDLHNIFIRRFRSAGEQLTRQFGNDAQAILDEALDDIVEALKARFPDE